MKLLLLILLPLATVMAGSEEAMITEMLYLTLADNFEIESTDVSKCFQKTGATSDDIGMLEREMSFNPDKIDVKNNRFRRAICALTCCAQVAGFMTGPKLEMDVIYLRMALEMEGSSKPYYLPYVTRADQCAAIAKNQTDECMVAYEFMTCFVKKTKQYMRETLGK